MINRSHIAAADIDINSAAKTTLNSVSADEVTRVTREVFLVELLAVEADADWVILSVTITSVTKEIDGRRDEWKEG